jgi:hypothetical protein
LLSTKQTAVASEQQQKKKKVNDVNEKEQGNAQQEEQQQVEQEHAVVGSGVYPEEFSSIEVEAVEENDKKKTTSNVW